VEGEGLVAATGIPATTLRPWYVLGPGHRWPMLLLPLYALLRLLPATHEALTRATPRDKVSAASAAMRGTQSRRCNRALTKEDDMSDRVRKVDYFYVMVPNTAGQAAKVLAALAAQGVNLLAFSGFPSGGKGQLDLVPEKSAVLRRAAKKLKLKLSKKKSGFLLQGTDRVGAMTRTLNTLAAAKINVTAMDAVAGGGKFAAIFWVKPKKVAKTAKLLRAR